MPRPLRRRAGFTMIEMIFAVSITVLVFSIAVPFFRAQTRAMDAGAGRLDAFQSARYAVWRIETDLRMAAGEVGQPIIVQAAPFAIAFNANRLGRTTTTDPNASYWDSSYDTLWTQSWLTSRALALRTSSKTYPTAAYTDASGNTSKAETIQYFLRADTAGGNSNLYVLYRKVNDRDSTLVTRDLYVPSDSNFFFRYYRTSASGTTSAMSKDSLPIYWDDASARADSITAVEVRATGRYWDARNRANVYRNLYVLVKLRNALQTLARNCGSAPPTPDSLGVTVENAPGGQKQDVRLDWTAVAGDSTAPRDVREYVLYRKLSAATSWTVIGSKPARGAGSYRYLDLAVPVAAGTYVYALAARDCSNLSAMRSGTAAVTFP
jgi:type II secretory pathway pseudopilin PulG